MVIPNVVDFVATPNRAPQAPPARPSRHERSALLPRRSPLYQPLGGLVDADADSRAATQVPESRDAGTVARSPGHGEGIGGHKVRHRTTDLLAR
jgi:hypothetical protein